MPRLTQRTTVYLIVVALVVAGLALVYWMYDGPAAQAQGTYELVMTFPESGEDGDENFGETFAPCRNQGNCNFSCGPSTVGRSCSTLTCTGGGNGDSAYFYTHSYSCVYTPPACSTTPDTSCAADTCSTDTCQATAADCSTYSIQGTKNCTPPLTCQDLDISLWGTYPNCYFPTCQQLGNCPIDDPGPTCQELDISLWGDYPPNCYYPTCQQLGNCPNACTPDTSCAANTCNTETCTATAADCSTYSISGTNPGACAAGDPPSVSCSPSSQNLPAGGGTANFSSSVSDGAGSPYAWLDGSNNVIGTGATLSRYFASDGSVRVRADNGSGGYVYSGYCTVDVADAVGGGGSCPDSDSATLTATPNRVRADMDTPIEIEWTGEDLDATSCTLTNMNTGDPVGSGSTVTACSTSGSALIPTGVDAQTVYRLQCGTFSKDVIVNIVPSFEEF